MVFYCNPYIEIIHTQQMEYQLVDKNASSVQIPSSCSSSSPENFNRSVNHFDNQDKNNIIPFEQQNTIEGFLVKAGGINPRSLMAADPTVQQGGWSKLQMMQQQQVSMAMPIAHSEVVDSGYRGCENNNEFVMMSSLMVPVGNRCFQNGVERKVICSSFKEEMMEKTVERRRKRMIKNRESAARSRARKQAHTNRLQLEVLELKKTNSWLKKHKEASNHSSKHSTSEPRYQLRRTSSTSF